MPKKRSNRPDFDGLMPEVDEEVRGGSREDDMSTSSQDDVSTSRESDKDTNQQGERSILEKQLDVLMEGPEGPYASELPDLRARANGYLSAEVEEALQQATSVLKNRYGKVSKSLIMDYAVRMVLWDLRENAEESQIATWLEKIRQE